MGIRIKFGAATCALLVTVPAFAQAPDTTGDDSPAATAGPAEEPDDAGAGAATDTTATSTEEHSTVTSEPAVEPAAVPVEERDENQRGFEFAVRVAYAIPLGDAVSDSSLSDAVAGGIPLQLDLGYRVDNHLFIGGYGTYLIGFEGDNCDDLDCSSPSGIRVGGEIIYNILPVTNSFSPWIGAGVGYEWLMQSVGDIDSTLRGMEFFNAQLGVDFRVGRYMRIGPYGLFALGQYSKWSVDDVSVDVDDKGTHEWIHLGVKATFGAWGGD